MRACHDPKQSVRSKKNLLSTSVAADSTRPPAHTYVDDVASSQFSDDPSGRSVERSSARTRERILDSAVALVGEQGLAMPLREIKLATVVKRLGLSVGAAYGVWSRQEDFHVDLAVQLMRHVETSSIEPVESAMLASIGSGGSFGDTLRAGANARFTSIVGSREFAARMAISASMGAEPHVQQVARDRYRVAFEGFCGVFRTTIDHYEREFADPWTCESTITALGALAEGFALQHVSFDSEDDRQSGRRLFADTAAAIATTATRPSEPNDGSVDQDTSWLAGWERQRRTLGRRFKRTRHQPLSHTGGDGVQS